VLNLCSFDFVMKLSCSLIRIIFILCIAWSSEGYNTKFKNVKCTSSNRSVFSNYTCFVKAYNRKSAVLNVRVKFLKPLSEIYSNFSLYYKQSTSIYYRKIMSGHVNYCDFLNDQNDNPVTKWILTVIRKSLPKNTFHPCPYDVSE
jgi:hypothetical protein